MIRILLAAWLCCCTCSHANTVTTVADDTLTQLVNNTEQLLTELRDIRMTQAILLESFEQNTIQTPVVVNSEHEAYNKAYQAMLTKQYDTARQLFVLFTKQYLHSHYLPNVHYWLGELYLLQQNYLEAQNSFSTVINYYPKSIKVPISMLKTVDCLSNLKQLQQAKKLLKKIISLYPNTTVAELANSKLGSLN